MNEPATLLLVDDDDAFRQRLARALTDRGFRVTACNGVDAALSELDEAPEYAVLDLRLNDGSGLTLLKELKARDPHTTVLLLTGYGSIPSAVEATQLGAVGYLSKPADADEVVNALLGQRVASPADETPSLARAEWEYIHRVLADASNNISEAARRLGLHRRSLQRKLHKRPPPR